MSKLIMGLALAAAGATALAIAGRRSRAERDRRAFEAVELARWEDECGFPSAESQGPPVGAPAVERSGAAAR